MVTRWNPILMFHEVLPDGTTPLPRYAVTQSMLRAILRDFTRRGYRPGTLDDVVPGRARGFRGKRLVLTFDDGTRDFLDYALPVLEEFGFRATLFIVTGYIGRRRSWKTPSGEALPEVPLMTADELRSLRARGYTIGSHTVTHRSLPSATPDEAAVELRGSSDALSDLLGEEVRWFAYPYTSATARSKEEVRRAGYVAACGGANQPHERYNLVRIEASAFTLPELRLRCNGLYVLTRQTVRRARYGRPK